MGQGPRDLHVGAPHRSGLAALHGTRLLRRERQRPPEYEGAAHRCLRPPALTPVEEESARAPLRFAQIRAQERKRSLLPAARGECHQPLDLIEPRRCAPNQPSTPGTLPAHSRHAPEHGAPFDATPEAVARAQGGLDGEVAEVVRKPVRVVGHVEHDDDPVVALDAARVRQSPCGPRHYDPHELTIRLGPRTRRGHHCGAAPAKTAREVLWLRVSPAPIAGGSAFSPPTTD